MDNLDLVFPGCPAPERKIFPFPFCSKQGIRSFVSFHHKGRIAIVTDAEWDAMDAAVSRVAMTWQGGPIS
jgi:hypothetical protein